MDREEILRALTELQNGLISREDLLRRFSRLGYEKVEGALVDHNRRLRTGFPEIIFGQNKKAALIITIATRLLEAGGNVLITRVGKSKAAKILSGISGIHHEKARLITAGTTKTPALPGRVVIISAGSADLPVVEEAAVTLRFFGAQPEVIVDAGVAGLHRLLAHLDQIEAADCAIVIAGMEGALPSVVAGLVSTPVIAVPTSVGYGWNLKGVSALLSMLNGCAGGVSVVNVDNGFGAARMAAGILRKKNQSA